MQWPGHLTFTLRSGESFRHVPNHLDYVLGAARAASRLDGGPLDGVISEWGGGGRTLGLYPSRRGLGRFGECGAGYDDAEEQLGLSRSYRLEIADPARTEAVRDALRDLRIVESASVQLLATTPMAVAAVQERPQLKPDAAEPFRRIHVPEAHALERGDKDITVAVVD